MQHKVFNLIIFDESGSMSCIKRQALNGLNETLQTIRQAAEEHPELTQIVSILPFQGHRLTFLRNKLTIDAVPDLTSEEYRPGGNTPLYDAIGLGIESIRNHVTENDTAVVTIITDGEENSSREYNAGVISHLIDELKHQGWMFSYIGANQDAVKVAESINIGNALNFVQDDAGTREMFEVERKSRKAYMKRQARYCQMDHATMLCCRLSDALDGNYFDTEIDN